MSTNDRRWPPYQPSPGPVMVMYGSSITDTGDDSLPPRVPEPFVMPDDLPPEPEVPQPRAPAASTWPPPAREMAPITPLEVERIAGALRKHALDAFASRNDELAQLLRTAADLLTELA